MAALRRVAHKGANGWNAARAISCLPALTGDFGLPGGGLGPRHGAQCAGFRNLSAPERRPPGNYIPNQMPDITEALSNGRLKVLLLLGTNMLSSFADAGRVADGLDTAEMIVCVDLFMNETARRFADVVLPGRVARGGGVQGNEYTSLSYGARPRGRVRRAPSTKFSGRLRIH